MQLSPGMIKFGSYCIMAFIVYLMLFQILPEKVPNFWMWVTGLGIAAAVLAGAYLAARIHFPGTHTIIPQRWVILVVLLLSAAFGTWAAYYIQEPAEMIGITGAVFCVTYLVVGVAVGR
jgi:hypothetical protein